MTENVESGHPSIEMGELCAVRLIVGMSGATGVVCLYLGMPWTEIDYLMAASTSVPVYKQKDKITFIHGRTTGR